MYMWVRLHIQYRKHSYIYIVLCMQRLFSVTQNLTVYYSVRRSSGSRKSVKFIGGGGGVIGRIFRSSAGMS